MEFIIVSVRFSSLLFILTKQEKFWQSPSLFLEYDSSPGSAWVEMTGKKKKKERDRSSMWAELPFFFRVNILSAGCCKRSLRGKSDSRSSSSKLIFLLPFPTLYAC